MLALFGPYVHNIDPILGKVCGLYLWWYGLGFTLGFLHLYLFLKGQRHRLGLTLCEVYNLSLFIMVGVLVGPASSKWYSTDGPSIASIPG